MRTLFTLLLGFTVSIAAFTQSVRFSSTTSADDDFPGMIRFAAASSVMSTAAPLNPAGLPQLPGWPKTISVNGLYPPSGIALADLDRNGTLEIIVASSDGKLHAWQNDGTAVSGFPVAVGNRMQSPPAVGDVDGDGLPEIVLCNLQNVFVYRPDGTILTGWPQPVLANTFPFCAPVLNDLDNDGKPEVIFGAGSNTGNLGRVFIWRFDGTPFPGWPKTLGNNYRITGTVSVGDIDGNNQPEIFAIGKKSGADSIRVFAYKTDGSQVAGWPYPVGDRGTSWSAGAIANIDPGSSSKEFLFVVGNFFSGAGDLHCVNANGTATTGFPVALPFAQAYPSVVVGDVDRDGLLEIVVAGLNIDALQYVIRNTGTIMPGWPQSFTTNIEGSSIMANFDSTATLELINGDNYTSNANLFCFTVNGTQAENFPLTMGGSMSVNSAAVGDVNKNGIMEMALMNANGTVNLWNTGRPYDSTLVEWGTFYHDNYRTNNYHFKVPPLTAVGDNRESEHPATAHLYQNYPNPFNPVTTIRFTIPEGTQHPDKSGQVAASLRVYDILGREVATLVNEVKEPGTHAVQWNAEGLASGVYLYRLRAGSFSQNRKMVIVR